MSVPPRPTVAATGAASGLLAEAVAAAPAVRLSTGGGRGLVTAGGGVYAYGVYVLLKMASLVGWDGPVEVWHCGTREPVPKTLFEDLGATVFDSAAAAAAERVPPPRGWEAKAFAVTRSALDTPFFVDADAYPVSDPTPLFALAEEVGEVFWPDDPNDNLRWRNLGLAVLPDRVPAVNGGQWVVSKALRAEELRLYAALNARGEAGLYDHMFGDQDCQRLAWHLTGRRYRLATPDFRKVGGVWVYEYPEGVPVIAHRVGCKMAPHGSFPSRLFTGPTRGAPLERQAVRFYREAVDRIGVPGRWA